MILVLVFDRLMDCISKIFFCCWKIVKVILNLEKWKELIRGVCKMYLLFIVIFIKLNLFKVCINYLKEVLWCL